MLIAWTTLSTREAGERLAQSVIEQRLATCVQTEGPVVSHFRWEGKIDRAEEFRLTFKCLPEQLPAPL